MSDFGRRAWVETCPTPFLWMSPALPVSLAGLALQLLTEPSRRRPYRLQSQSHLTRLHQKFSDPYSVLMQGKLFVRWMICSENRTFQHLSKEKQHIVKGQKQQEGNPPLDEWAHPRGFGTHLLQFPRLYSPLESKARGENSSTQCYDAQLGNQN